MVPTSTAGLRSLLAGLKKNATCMVLPDQRPAEKTGWIDSTFFRQPAKTSLLIKNLAQRVECDIFIATLNRSLDTGRYQLHMQRLGRDDLLQEDLASATYLNQRIEEMVSDQICQYQWGYRRFDESAYQAMREDKIPENRG
jgi:lauroyl/myristoyl acyltransferase